MVEPVRMIGWLASKMVRCLLCMILMAPLSTLWLQVQSVFWREDMPGGNPYAKSVDSQTGVERVVSIPCYLAFKRKGWDGFGSR